MSDMKGSIMSTITVTSPYDGKSLGEYPLMGLPEVHAALETAKKTYDNQKEWLKKHQRIHILERTVEIMKEEIELLTHIAASEGGKPYMDSKVEVQRAINGVKLAIEHLGVYGGKEIPMGQTESSENRMAYTMMEPIGVVLAISAFNHPLNLAVHQIIPALAVGAPVIIRPSSSTPMSTLHFVDILYRAGLPKVWCQVILCSTENAEVLVKSPKIDFLTFIGSAHVGWHLRSIVAPGTRVSLEHGGVAPVIVEPDATLDTLIPSLVKGGYYHAGQVCVSVQRVFVHEDILHDVASRICSAASALKVGDPLDPQTEVGPLIAPKEVDRVDAWVKEAIQSGGQLLCGAKKLANNCYAPTVILNPSDKATISQNEVFGPVVCLYSYKALDEALAQANALDVSFQAAVFTHHLDHALYAVKHLNAKTVMVNDHTAFRVDWMPFGGAKASGLGVGGIPYAMEEMSNVKLMVIKSSVL